MKSSSPQSGRPLKGIAALFDDSERKELFRKYLFFLGWVEVLIIAICYLYQLGDQGYDHVGAVEASFPWRTYFLVSFLAPVTITFLIGLVIVGFNKYFGEAEIEDEGATFEQENTEVIGNASSRIYKLQIMVRWIQRLPFLALLLLLCVAAILIYKLEAFLAFVGSVGEQSVKYLLMGSAFLLIVASIFGFTLIILNYQLRKKAMAYQYKSEVAERFGLIILDDNTVLSKEGKLLVQGKGLKDAVPLLPVETNESSQTGSDTAGFRAAVDLETS